MQNYFVGQKVSVKIKGDESHEEGFIELLNEKGDKIINIPRLNGFVRLCECEEIKEIGIRLREDVEERVKETLEKFDSSKVAEASPEDREKIYDSVIEDIGEDAKSNEEEVKDMVDGFILQSDIDSGKKEALEAVTDYLKDEYKLQESANKLNELDINENPKFSAFQEPDIAVSRMAKTIALLGEKILDDFDFFKGDFDDCIDNFIAYTASPQEVQICNEYYPTLKSYISYRLNGGRLLGNKNLVKGALKYIKAQRNKEKRELPKSLNYEIGDIENGKEYKRLKEAAYKKFNRIYKNIKDTFEGEQGERIDLMSLIDEYEELHKDNERVKLDDLNLLEYICSKLDIDTNEVLKDNKNDPKRAIIALFDE